MMRRQTTNINIRHTKVNFQRHREESKLKAYSFNTLIETVGKRNFNKFEMVIFKNVTTCFNTPLLKATPADATP